MSARRLTLIKRAALAAALVMCAAPLALVALVEVGARLGDAPDLSRPPSSTRLYDRHGELLREAVGDAGARAQAVQLDEVAPAMVDATIAVEDERFFRHGGVDWVAVARATLQNLAARRVVSGASTLTMQLARLVEPHPRTVVGKLGEMMVARRIERAHDKHTILEQYLNRAPYGAGAIGVEAAAQRTFGAHARNLSLAQAALLAALPQAPSSKHPLRSATAERAARARQAKVLERLVEAGHIDAPARDAALTEPLAFLREAEPPRALHFTDMVLAARVHDGLGGGDVTTTLDATLQQKVEGLAREHGRSVQAQGAKNAAVVVLDNRRCEVIALVGSLDYWAKEGGSVNGALARRQPGSALKPFTYALAFAKGFSPASVVADVETRYGETDGSLFKPKNYDHDFHGPVMMGDALGRSLNVPAIRTAQQVGVDELLALLRSLGLRSLDHDGAHYGLGLTLGNGEVTPLELAQAYAALARGGRACDARLTVDDGQAQLHDHGDDDARPIDEATADLVTHVLKSEDLRMRAFGQRTALLVGFPVAIKTGTSTNFRDSWAAGYTPEYTVVVWVGDFAGRPMNQVAGAAGAGPLLAAVLRALHPPARPPRWPAPPAGVVDVELCAESGRLPEPHCPHRRTVRLRAQDLPTEACPWHKVLALDARNGLRAGPNCPRAHVVERTFALLPPTYAAWQAESGTAAPARFSPLCPADGVVADAVTVTYPRGGEVFVVEPGYQRGTQSVRLAADVDPPVERLSWIVDGAPVASVGFPYVAHWPLAEGEHRIEARAGKKRSEPVIIRVE